MKSGSLAHSSPFHRYSTLLGLFSSLVVVVAVGWSTHWRLEILLPVYLIAFPVFFVLFARIFYGFRASRALDKENISPGSGWTWRDADLVRPSFQLEDAYEKAQQGDESDLKRIAEEEQSS